MSEATGAILDARLEVESRLVEVEVTRGQGDLALHAPVAMETSKHAVTPGLEGDRGGEVEEFPASLV